MTGSKSWRERVANHLSDSISATRQRKAVVLRKILQQSGLAKRNSSVGDGMSFGLQY